MTKTTEGFLPVTLRLPHTAVWKDRDALWRFMDLLFMCSFSDRQVRIGGKDVETHRGETLISVRELALRWGMTRDQVNTFLSMLQRDGLAVIEKDVKRFTRIRFLVFSAFPASKPASKPASEPASGWAEYQDFVSLYPASESASKPASKSATYTRNTNIRNYKKKENLYIRENELDLEDKFNNPDNFLW